jgi:hypothetical protein
MGGLTGEQWADPFKTMREDFERRKRSKPFFGAKNLPIIVIGVSALLVGYMIYKRGLKSGGQFILSPHE